MKPTRWTSLLIILLALALFALAAWRLDSLKQLRSEHDLDPADVHTEAQVAARLRIPTIGLSVFRSLAIDYLWIRADNLKQQGQYFDALHLARLICELQPQLPSVWKFQAWNMTYNISVAMPTAPERWNWVLAGIELLRDKGLRACPGQADLYRELAWYFHHKIGGVTDEYHWYYKEQLARVMMQLLGPAGGTNDELRRLDAAPLTWDDLLADPNVATVLDRVADLEHSLNSTDTFVENWLRFAQQPEDFSIEFRQYLMDHAQDPDLITLDRFARAWALRNHWRLDPKFMLDLNHRYGPVDFENPQAPRTSLDWRLPFAHGLYWACQGLPDAQPASFDYLQLQRMVYGNLQDLFHKGQLQLLVFEQPPPDLEPRQPGQEILQKQRFTELRMFLSQDLRMFPAAWQATQEVLQAYRDAGQEVPQSVEDAGEYIAWAGIENLYLLGRSEAAGYYFRILRQQYPDNPDYRLPLDQFVRTRILEEVEQMTPKRAAAYIDSLLRNAHRYWAQLNDEMAMAFYARAEQVHALYLKQHDLPTARIKMPPLSEMAILAYQHLLTDPVESPIIKQVLLARLQQENPQVLERIQSNLQQAPTNGPTTPKP